eukprot:jgi/Botrbrau1/597/Bobra.0010s0061.1
MAHEDGYLPLHREMRMFSMGPIVFLQPVAASGEEQAASLTVELNNGVVGLAEFSGASFGKTETVYGVIGMAKLLGGSVLAVITAREKVAQLRGEERIQSHRSKGHQSQEQRRQRRCQVLFAKFDAIKGDPSKKSRALYTRADPTFLFNRHLIQPLTECEASHVVRFVLPIMQGFVESIPMQVGDYQGQLTLIARRSTLRPGVRHWRRGADPQGAVANFVETEQLIPNIKYKPTTHIAPPSSYEPVFERHVKDLIDNYQEVVAINLANQHGTEGLLGQKMAEQAECFSASSPGLRLVPFDFHKECGTSRYDRLDLLWELISGDVARLGYYLEAPGLGLALRQKGVVRTNCIDCLDRTNVVQGWLGRQQLEALLTRLAILPATRSLAEAFPLVDQRFKVIWADHGDAVSRQYAGTGALKSGFTRTGKRTLGGLIDDGLKSLTRYYLNNFEDGRKQDAYDLLTGTYAVSKEKPSPFKPHSTLWPVVTAIFILGAWSYALWRTPIREGLWFSPAIIPAGAAIALLWYVAKNGKKYVLKPQLCPSLAQPW